MIGFIFFKVIFDELFVVPAYAETTYTKSNKPLSNSFLEKERELLVLKHTTISIHLHKHS